MRVANRFRRTRAGPTDLPGGYPASGGAGAHGLAGGKGFRKHRNGGYVALLAILALLFVVAAVTYLRRDTNEDARAEEEALGRWTKSPPMVTGLSEERKHAVLEELKGLASRQLQRPQSHTDTPTTMPTSSPSPQQHQQEQGQETHPTATPTLSTATTAQVVVPTPQSPQAHTRGQLQPEHPEQLPGLTIHHRTYTPDELMALHGNFTIVYTFVNGSEANHYYRKRMVRECMGHMATKEAQWYLETAKFYENATTRSPYTQDPQSQDPQTQDPQQQDDEEHAAEGFNELLAAWIADQCMPKYLRTPSKPLRTMGDVWQRVQELSTGGADNRDRETDELRHSLRSVEQHMPWHRGRVVLVSPGHHPLWMDSAKNFLAGMCGGDAVRQKAGEGSYLRVITAHQDAVMPYGIKLTTNSHVIEQHLWRVNGIGAVHVYYNDDYFVNRDVAITDLFNAHGGTIVRTEKGVIGPGQLADQSASWVKGVRHTTLFNILELDDRPENYLPLSLENMWKRLRRVGSTDAAGTVTVPVPDLTEVIDTAFLYHAEPMPNVTRENRRLHRFATHAPFVYCTNMFAFIETRYEREFAYNTLSHRGRKARDLFIPFVYNAFVMTRPWQASPKFLPYLLRQKASVFGGAVVPQETIALDNFDGCGPASMLSGMPESGCFFAKFSDDTNENERTMKAIAKSAPLYFNINAGFKTAEASDQLRRFLQQRFPNPIYLERGVAPVSDEDRALPKVYAALMRLPVIAVSSFAEGLCPMVRSLQLALPDHTGAVVSAVARHGTGVDVDPTLSELRTVMVHRVRSAVPAVACAFNERVRGLRAAVPAAPTRADALGAAVLARIVDSALSELRANGTVVDAAVVPSVCGVGVGAGVGGGGDVRVRAIVLDGRAAVTDALSLRRAVTMPGQTLALEDFDVVPLEDGSGDAVLVLSRQRSDAKAVHWIDGAAENDLLVTFPIPYIAFEDLSAPLVWSGLEV